MSIEFVHYMRPAGRMVVRQISRSQAIEDKAAAIKATGAHFEVREQAPGEARIACICADGAVAYKTVPIVGNTVEAAVDAVVEKAYAALVERKS